MYIWDMYMPIPYTYIFGMCKCINVCRLRCMYGICAMCVVYVYVWAICCMYMCMSTCVCNILVLVRLLHTIRYLW
ncbi:hypothetical protein EON63_12875 [archaeon]|nr:MAG: hypothetical protein EON63_12875 [archaeon]